MGGAGEIICPYCSTLYRYRADLQGAMSDPPGCEWTPDTANAAA